MIFLSNQPLQTLSIPLIPKYQPDPWIDPRTVVHRLTLSLVLASILSLASLRNTHAQAFEDREVNLASEALEKGEASRGAVLFASAKSACLSCHKIDRFGGSVGPDLTEIGRKRKPEHLAQSLLAPNKHVEDPYRVVQVVTSEGEVVRGFRSSETERAIVIRDPARGTEQTISKEDVEKVVSAPSLMPEGLLGSMNLSQQRDLLAFLIDLGNSNKLRVEVRETILAHAQSHDPTPFPYERKPLDPSRWPHWESHVNRDRVYDFYAKEARHFRKAKNPPSLLAEYPGVDDGKYGHWGNQNEETWASDAWNRTLLGTVQGGVFHGPNGMVVPRSVCLRLGDQGELSACFNPETWSYEAVWSDGFLKFSSVRHGFMHGLLPDGKMQERPIHEKPKGPFEYRGFYRAGKRVFFVYRVGNEEYLDAPWVDKGRLVSTIAPRDQHPLRHELENPKSQWPEQLETAIHLGSQVPYAIDTIELPKSNPWNALIFCGDHDFLPDGSALVCTMHGDVWHVAGFGGEGPSLPKKAIWRRFASGLHQALGIKIDKDGIYVLGRDQITRLHDLNKDGEADYYERFSAAYITSPAGHDFICGLQRDSDGNFYTASGNQGLLRIERDGKRASVLATGFRNPDGLGIYPDRVVTVPCSEGNWTPTSMICAVRAPYGESNPSFEDSSIPFYGYRGGGFKNKPIEKPILPMIYLPRGIDNSSGGQVYIDSQRWGPLGGNMIHLSYGTGSHFLLLRDEVEGILQGAVVPLPGEFLAGAHRARFSARDGQLYVSGMGGWGTYTPENGCFHRVRYVGDKVELPIGIHFHENGIAIRFTKIPDPNFIQNAHSHFVQAWNYRYSSAYGSPEYSTLHYGVRGHDRLEIASCHWLSESQTLFLEIPELQPTNQLHLLLGLQASQDVELFATCHRLDKPRTDFPGYQHRLKPIAPHPIEMDVSMAAKRIPNPWKDRIEGARGMTIEADKNLSFKTKSIRVRAGEPIALTLVNPDVVPHNWALVQPGSLEKVGIESNRLVSDPEAVIYHYVPQVESVLCYTDIVEPTQQMTIYFRAPETKGRYPYLCTFPGHWMVMNGEMIVE